MRAGSRSSAKRKLGFSHINAHTSAVKPIIIRINPGMPRKPKRRSSLSSKVMRCRSVRFTRLVFNIGRFTQSPLPVLRSRVTEAAPKKTPLYDEHVRLGAKMVLFAGWLMPVQYTGIVDEHQAVRNDVGIFDISHMGQFIVDGAGACDWLNNMLTNNINKLDVGMGQYTFLLNERGGIIDDLIVYRIGDQNFLLVVNAARAEEDFAWLQKHLPAVAAAVSAANTVQIDNRSTEFGGVAIQGPRLVELFHALFGAHKEPPARNHIVDLPFDGMKVSVARTGYTGEE